MIEPPVDAPPEQATPEPPVDPRPDPPIEEVQREIRLAIVSAAQRVSTAETAEEAKDAAAGLLGASQALRAVDPTLDPKVFLAMFLPQPQDTGQSGGQATSSRPSPKAK